MIPLAGMNFINLITLVWWSETHFEVNYSTREKGQPGTTQKINSVFFFNRITSTWVSVSLVVGHLSKKKFLLMSSEVGSWKYFISRPRKRAKHIKIAFTIPEAKPKGKQPRKGSRQPPSYLIIHEFSIFHPIDSCILGIRLDTAFHHFTSQCDCWALLQRVRVPSLDHRATERRIHFHHLDGFCATRKVKEEGVSDYSHSF